MKEEVSSSILLSIAVTLLTLGVNQLQSGNTTVGLLCVLVGFGLVCVTTILVERGIISKVQRSIAH
jgi:predicted cobalt transporter CbtA